MHRLVQISFADLEIGDYFSLVRGRPRDTNIYRKTSEHQFKLARGQTSALYKIDGTSLLCFDVPSICFDVLRRTAPHKHHRAGV